MIFFKLLTINYSVIFIVLALPGPPVITANPEGPVRSGSRVSLSCISEGTDSNTRVYWYRDGRLVSSRISFSCVSKTYRLHLVTK